MSSCFFETPQRLAETLARYVPVGASRVLDPAVGNGSLIAPLLTRKGIRLLVGVDIRKKAIKTVKKLLCRSSLECVELIRSDFLRWCDSSSAHVFYETIDCVIMNPPFGGKKQKYVGLDCEGRHRRVSREAAFVVKSISFLRSGGLLLAVLPPQLISGITTSWFRNLMMEQGCIQAVHETPKNCFAGVESRMYLLVWRKSVKQNAISLLNHDLEHPESQKMRIDRLDKVKRLDYKYYDCNGKRAGQDILLGEVVDIIRGDARSPRGKSCAVHTTDFKNGNWYIRKRHQKFRRGNLRFLEKGDFLLARVGRRCTDKFGTIKGDPTGCRATDCIWILRPKIKVRQIVLKLAIKAALKSNQVALERGVGAQYSVFQDLYHMPVCIKRETK